MKIPGARRALGLCQWVKSRFQPGPLILGYHRIETVPRDPQHLCVSPQHFTQQLDVLRRKTSIIPLAELVATLGKGKSQPGQVVLTFDDGYADTLYNAKPLLEAYAAPATVFVSTGFLGKEFWWCTLERYINNELPLPERVELSLRAKVFRWFKTGDSSAVRRQLLRALEDFFRTLNSAQQAAALSDLKRTFASAENSTVVSGRCMEADELRELVASGLIEVGSHTVSHCSLGGLSPDAQRMELSNSTRALEAIVQRPVVSCSYPNGSWSPQTPAVAREAGLHCACTSAEAVVAPGASPYRLPRFWLPDWNGERFERWLGWWTRRYG